MWALLREVSIRHLRHALLRTTLVIFGIALGVSMLSAVLAANASLLVAFRDIVDRVAGQADLMVSAGSAGLPAALTAEIAEVDGVAHAAATAQVVTRTADGQGGPVLVLGVDFLGDTFFLPFAQPGERQVVSDPLAFVNDAHAVLVAKRFARTHQLAVDSPLVLLTPEGEQTFYVRGLLEDEGPAASFGGQVVVMFIDALQVAFGRGDLVDRIDVMVQDDRERAAVQARVRARVQGTADVEPPSGRSARLLTALSVFRNGLNACGLSALWVGMFLIYNAVSISVAQRRHEIGVLRALGVTRSGVTGLFCAEALLMGLVGGLIGLSLGKVLAQFALASAITAIGQYVLPIQPPPPRLTLGIVATSLGAGLAATLLAAYLPARQSAHVDPADALRATRATALMRALPERKLAWIGAAIAALSFVPAELGGELNGYVASTVIVVGLSLFVPLCVRWLRRALVGGAELAMGIPGRLALDNVERSLGRTAITVISLMLAVSMSTTIATYARSFERSIVEAAQQAFPCDAMLTAGSPMLDRQHIPFSRDVLDKLARVPGLARVNPVRFAWLNVHDIPVQTVATDAQIYFDPATGGRRGLRVAAGPPEIDARALAEAPRVVISENLARSGGLSVGDHIELPTPSGPQRFQIYALVVNYAADQGWLMLDQKWYRTLFRDERVDAAELFFQPGMDPERAAQQVRAHLGASGSLFVTLQKGMREQFKAVSANVFALARAPEVITLLVAMMGVIGTMFAAVLDRVREIGLLRAVGATRRQVVISLAAEGAFLGLAAALCGVAAGVPQGYLFLKVTGVATTGWNLPYAFPLQSALRLGAEILIGAALAGWLPGLRAARLDVGDALAYE